MTTYVRADEAARMLGVSKPTLYAYVSRGIVTRRSAADGRTSLYARDELEALAERNQRRPVAEPTIDIVIRSTITEIADEQVRYRSHDLDALVRSHGFEATAELLWSGRLPDAPVRWPIDREAMRRAIAVARAAGAIDPITSLTLSLTGLSGDDAADVARRALSIAPTVLGGPQRGSTAERLAAAWRRSPDPALVAAIDRALVLLADHELASSTLAVRVACSVGAAPADSLAAGLHTVAGTLHGGASRLVVDLLRSVGSDGAREAVAAVLRAGRRLPGFGHAVYRTADPRLAPLLDAVRNIPDADGRMATVEELLAEAGRVLGKVPNVDLGLGALMHVGRLPDDAPLFAIARLAGWAAHHAEEATERPARYRGLTRR